MSQGSSRRYPMEVQGVGVIQHPSQKTYMMMVMWSDRNNIPIYRTFEEFKKLHRSLKKKFPIEAGHMKKSERTIPKLKDAPVFIKRRRDSRRFLVRLKLLETYAQELLRTDAKISHGEDVTAFFTAQTRDLDTAFLKNSIVIMPSEARDGRRETPRQQAGDSVIQPIRSEQHCCVETYETKDTKNRPFKVCRDELLDVLLKDNTGWWLVENDDKQLAWFPAPYLSKLKTSEETPRSRESNDGLLYFAVKCFEAKGSDELSVSMGVVVEVLEKSEDGWWLVWYNEQVGYVPSMFLQPYKNPHQEFHAIARNGLHTSTPNLVEPASATLPPRAVVEEEDSLESVSKGYEDNASGRSLQRRKSRSLSSLPTAPATKSRPPLTLELASLSEDAGAASACSRDGNWRPTPLPRNIPVAPDDIESLYLNIGQMDSHAQGIHKSTPKSRLSKDDGLGESFSTSGSDQSLYSSNPDSKSEIPKIPQKPELYEIMQRCSTVTKKALQRASLNSIYTTVP
ncbi:NADPH oxidase organizer 1-like [Ambystoma mexicanum]|uniref:NADPH oxidase organizer 1-like n=1 Tax=Ambystoma mexicanum TaxID=8296 RepID=UPI0037E93CE3